MIHADDGILSQEQRLMRDSCRSFVDDVVTPFIRSNQFAVLQVAEPDEGENDQQSQPVKTGRRSLAHAIYFAACVFFNAARNCSRTASGLMTCRHTLSAQGVLRWLAALTQGEQARPA